MRRMFQFIIRMLKEIKDQKLISALEEEKRLNDNKMNYLFAEIDELK